MRYSKSLSRILTGALLTAGLSTASAAPVAADCLLDYVRCVEDASDLANFGLRSIGGLKCSLDFIACFQRRLA